jgi:hypothetical protein
MTAIVSPGLEAALADYDQKWWRHDTRVKGGIERVLVSEIGVYTDRDIASSDELKTHPFFTEFLTKRGLGYFMGGSVSPLPKVCAGMSLQGRLGGDPFPDEDVALLALLGRRVEKALRAPSFLHPAKESPCNEISPQPSEANEGVTLLPPSRS